MEKKKQPDAEDEGKTVPQGWSRWPALKNRFGQSIAQSQWQSGPERFIEPGYLEQWVPVLIDGIYPAQWHQINLLCRRLAVKFNPQSMAREFKEDSITHVVGVARGGLVPATMISYALEVPLLSYAVSTYNVKRGKWPKSERADDIPDEGRSARDGTSDRRLKAPGKSPEAAHVNSRLKAPGKFYVRQSLNLKELKETNAHVLVVDDICDSGDTLMYVSDIIAESGLKAKYTTLFAKERSMKLLDRYGTLIADDTWIQFPWE